MLAATRVVATTQEDDYEPTPSRRRAAEIAKRASDRAMQIVIRLRVSYVGALRALHARTVRRLLWEEIRRRKQRRK